MVRNFSQFIQTLSGIGSKSNTFKSHCRFELAKVTEIYLKYELTLWVYLQIPMKNLEWFCI